MEKTNNHGTGEVELYKSRDLCLGMTDWEFHAYSPNRYFSDGKAFGNELGDECYLSIELLARDIIKIHSSDEEIHLVDADAPKRGIINRNLTAQDIIKDNTHGYLTQIEYLTTNEMAQLGDTIKILRKLKKSDLEAKATH